VALEALKGDLTLAQLAAKHGVHQTMISTWRKQAVDGIALVFSGKAEAAETNQAADVDKLQAKIGQLAVERDFLARGFGR
jgi:transposase